ncbi:MULTISPECIES: hypothetical protein [Streptomyces]|uniref:hypothetical protein n=1 Tax=[Kitasatospora] papulosa TaxID=1464011 RepID=UPI0036C8EB38
MFTALVAQADADGDLNWTVSVDSTMVRIHQHAAGGRKKGPRWTSRLTTPSADPGGRADHHNPTGLRLPSADPFDREAYKQRTTVKRGINLKQWRGIATRYEKTATIYWLDSNRGIFLCSAR